MGQLYYAQTQLYSTVLGVKFSGQYELNIAIHYSLLCAKGAPTATRGEVPGDPRRTPGDQGDAQAGCAATTTW